MDEEAILELGAVESKLNELMPKLSKRKIYDLKRAIEKHYVKRFKGKRDTQVRLAKQGLYRISGNGLSKKHRQSQVQASIQLSGSARA